MKLRIWTRGYRPFILGGNCNADIGTEVEVGDPFSIGKGYKAYLVTSPDGEKTFVAEATTGAIVGGSIKQVKRDMREADSKVVEQQIEDAKKRLKEVEWLESEDFWRIQT